jgi:small subunit ribosomal protein S8
MSLSDPIADMLTCIRNGSAAKREKIDVPASRVNEDILKVLKGKGFIQNYRRIEDRKQDLLRLYLGFGDNRKSPAITHIKRVSKPGLRVYVKADKIPHVLSGLGIAILSTPKGIMNDKDARTAKVGGEVICYVW